MKIILLARNPNLYSHKRLIDVAKERGHIVKVIDALQVYMNISPHSVQIRYQGKPLEEYGVIIPRIGASITFYGLAVLRQFEMMGVWPLNDSVSIGKSRDKLKSLQLLAKKGIGLPITAYAHSTQHTDDMIEMVGGAPLVIKLLEGTQGIGVVLGETHSSARSVIEAFRGANVNILVQEYIKESNATDIRCFVVGGEVIAAMQRTGAPNDFRSNLHRGGTASPVEITEEERSTAIRAASIMGLKICGVDLLRSNRGPIVMEVNSSPGLKGIETTTGIDVATQIIKFIETNGPLTNN